MVATGANAQKLPPDRRGPPKTMVPVTHPPRSMDDIAEGARRVLNHIENNGTEDRYVTGYIRAVRQYALNAQRGDAMGMAKVLEALTKINADTERLNQRMTTIEASTSNLTRSLSSLPADSAAAWRSFRARDWQRGLATATAPNIRSNGTSSSGVPEIELREDREVIVKVGPNREQIRTLSPKELVERAERQRATVARQKNSAALAGGASFVAARKLPSGDVAMVANSAAGAELLRKYTEWLRAFGPGAVVQEPSWGVVAYNIPVRSMKLTPETMAEVARELLTQNDWDENANVNIFRYLLEYFETSHSNTSSQERCTPGEWAVNQYLDDVGPYPSQSVAIPTLTSRLAFKHRQLPITSIATYTPYPGSRCAHDIIFTGTSTLTFTIQAPTSFTLQLFSLCHLSQSSYLFCFSVPLKI